MRSSDTEEIERIMEMHFKMSPEVCVFDVAEMRIISDDRSRILSRAQKNICIIDEIRQLQLGKATLTPPEEISRTPDFEINLCDFETIGRRNHRPEPAKRLLFLGFLVIKR